MFKLLLKETFLCLDVTPAHYFWKLFQMQDKFNLHLSCFKIVKRNKVYIFYTSIFNII